MNINFDIQTVQRVYSLCFQFSQNLPAKSSAASCISGTNQAIFIGFSAKGGIKKRNTTSNCKVYLCDFSPFLPNRNTYIYDGVFSS